MSKRARGDGQSGPQASSEDAVSGLASWCDEKLRVLSERIHDLPDQTPKGIVEAVDNEFDDVIDDMGEEMQIQVPTETKESVQQKWRRVGSDAVRVWAMQAQMKEQARETYLVPAHAQTALSEMLTSTEDTFDLWFFNLGWEFASFILSNGGEEVKSESADSDEPANESESGEEEEEEEEESGSESGSGTGSDD